MTQPVVHRSWISARPFWGGLLVCLAGLEMLLAVKAPLPIVLHVGMQGMVGYILPIVLFACGLLLLFNPAQRLFYAIVAAVLTIASWLTSNLGGFVFGIILGLLGSALAFAWSPAKQRKPKPAAVTRPAEDLSGESEPLELFDQPPPDEYQPQHSPRTP